MTKKTILILIIILLSFSLVGADNNYSSIPKWYYWLNSRDSFFMRNRGNRFYPTMEESKFLVEVRNKNLKNYYSFIKANRGDFSPYLQYGLYTRNSDEIEKLANELWNNDTIITHTELYTINMSTGGLYLQKSSNTKMVYTEDAVLDYLNKINNWVYYNIKNPDSNANLKNIFYPTQQDADMVLKYGAGYCDEIDILTKSLLLAKGIPSQIRILDSPYRRHSAMLVLINNGWIKFDPTLYKGIGFWLYDIEVGEYEDITDRAPFDGGYTINTNKW